MKILLTGSLGNIGKPVATELVKKGHTVTVISRNEEKQKEIEALGAIFVPFAKRLPEQKGSANAAIGSLEDVSFLTATFTGADVVYCMIPPSNFFDPDLDLFAYCRKIANNYAQAIQQSGVKRVVYLSSIGADLERGSGIVLSHQIGESILNNLSDVAIVIIRAASLYNNLYGYVETIKNQGVIAANYGADDKYIWVSRSDIAAAIVEELETPLVGRKVRYVASDELTCNETATILGTAIGKPDLQWKIVSSDRMLVDLEATGMNPQIAAGLVEMYAGVHSGMFLEDYYRNRPTTMGKVKMTDFAKEFAAAF